MTHGSAGASPWEDETIMNQAVWKDDVVTLLRNSAPSPQPSPPNISPVTYENWQRFFWAKCLGERELKRFALKYILFLKTNLSPSRRPTLTAAQRSR